MILVNKNVTHFDIVFNNMKLIKMKYSECINVYSMVMVIYMYMYMYIVMWSIVHTLVHVLIVS